MTKILDFNFRNHDILFTFDTLQIEYLKKHLLTYEIMQASEVVKDFLTDFCHGKLHDVCEGCTRGIQEESRHDCVMNTMKCVCLILDDIDKFAFDSSIDASSHLKWLDFDQILPPANFISMLADKVRTSGFIIQFPFFTYQRLRHFYLDDVKEDVKCDWLCDNE